MAQILVEPQCNGGRRGIIDYYFLKDTFIFTIMNKYLTILICLLALANIYAQTSCSSQRYQTAIFSQVTKADGIKFATADPYGIIDQQDLLLDIYQPTGDTLSKRPVIVYAYGGGFLIGTRNQPPIPYYADFYTKLGYVFVSIEYRLGFNVTTPGSPERAVYRSVQDVRAAVRHLAQRANQYRIDTGRIILMGSSAGNFAAFHSTYMELSQAVNFATPIPILDGEILGPIDTCGSNDFQNKYIEPFAIVNQWGALADTAWIDTDERVPVISFHGDGDNAVPYDYGYPFSYPVFPNVYGSRPIHQRLDNLGIHNRLVTLVGYGHEPELLNLDLRDTVLLNSAAFLFSLLQPQTTPIVGKDKVCTNTQYQYAVNFTLGSRYCWTVSGNANVIQTANSIEVIWTDTGLVTITVREINKNGAEGILLSKIVNVYPKVSANFGYAADGFDLTFVNLSSGQSTNQWSFGNGQSSLLLNPTNVYSTAGTYTNTLVAFNEGCADTFSTNISVDTCPVADFTFTNNQLNGLFAAQSTNTSVYEWDFGDGQTSNSPSPNVLHIYAQTGIYTVVLKVKNSIGCQQSDTVTINLSPSDAQEYALDYKPKVWLESRQFFCQTGANVAVNIRLVDLSGREVLNEQFIEQSSYDLTHLLNGIYLATITTDNLSQSVKFFLK